MDSIMFLEIAKPKPVPELFVVKLGTKTLSFLSSVIPIPLSLTLRVTISLVLKTEITIRPFRSSGMDC
jgi:hypothetical protein